MQASLDLRSQADSYLLQITSFRSPLSSSALAGKILSHRRLVATRPILRLGRHLQDIGASRRRCHCPRALEIFSMHCCHAHCETTERPPATVFTRAELLQRIGSETTGCQILQTRNTRPANFSTRDRSRTAHRRHPRKVPRSNPGGCRFLPFLASGLGLFHFAPACCAIPAETMN